jgi:hypothetical protein
MISDPFQDATEPATTVTRAGKKSLADSLSPSRIGMLLRCEAQFMFRYVEGKILPPDSAFFFGLRYEDAVDFGYEEKLRTEELPPLDDIRDKFVSVWDECKEEAAWQSDDDPDALKDTGTRLLGAWRPTAETVQPKDVQKHISTILPDRYGDPFELHGIIDLETTDGTLVDNKTSKRSYDADGRKVVGGLQGLQAMTYSLITGLPRFEWHVGVKLKTPRLQVISAEMTPDDHAFARNVAGIARSKIQTMETSGDFLPNRGHFMCTRRHCGYWEMCEKRYGGAVKE